MIKIYQVNGSGYPSLPSWDLQFVVRSGRRNTIKLDGDYIEGWAICSYTKLVYRGVS